MRKGENKKMAIACQKAFTESQFAKVEWLSFQEGFYFGARYIVDAIDNPLHDDKLYKQQQAAHELRNEDMIQEANESEHNDLPNRE